MLSRPSSQHIRSLSTAPKRSESPANRVSRAISTSALHTMVAVANVPVLASPQKQHTLHNDEDETMSTIPDPRSRTMSPAYGSPPSPSHHPDLSNEVAALSNKLINAINHQTTLEDSLSATHHELDTARQRIRQLEFETKDHAEQISQGLLLRSSIVQAERRKLIANVADEKRQRVEMEWQKKRMEQELENLTQALFEEANKMVTSAREEASKDHDMIQRRNDQLRSQLADTETLLSSHQEQLAELKQVMEQMGKDREDQLNFTAPSTPGVSKLDRKEEPSEGSGALHPGTGEAFPSYPTNFTHLLRPVLRTDLPAFDDFMSLLRTSKNNLAGSRASSGSYAGIGIGLTLGAYTNHSSPTAPSNGSTSSINTAPATGSSPATPTTPASTVSTASTRGPNSATPLRETRFYKRALAEDIEPTLRLDTAPGLSWLARRTVLNAICEGTLIVEPMIVTSSSKLYVYACSLCGETRKDPSHFRTHRFRTGESDNAQRYPLCKYCLGRVRSSCDFLGFLKVLKDGLWRTDDEEGERAAWEESVRLREQMFWCRIGGGVVPVNPAEQNSYLHRRDKSPKLFDNEGKDQENTQRLGEEVHMMGEIRPKDVSSAVGTIKPDDSGNQSFFDHGGVKKSREKDNSADGLWEAAQLDAVKPNWENIGDKMVADREEHKYEEIRSPNHGSTQSLSTCSDEEKRLSITIPGTLA